MSLPPRKRSRVPRWRAAGVVLAVALVLPACGSTVQQQGAAGGPAQGELNLPGPSIPGSAQPLGPGSVAPGQTGALRPNATQTGAPGGPGQPTLPPNASGRGFTAKEIYIGYATTNGANNAFKAAGVNADFGDQEAQAEAIVNDLNARGGVAGRKIVPVFYDFQAIATDPSTDAQAACDRWTQDRPVFAVVKMLGIGGETALAACLAKRQTPLVNVVPAPRPRSYYARHDPYLLGPEEAAMERFVPAWMQRVAAHGYFGGWNTMLGQAGNAQTRIGVLSVAPLYGEEFTRNVREALAKLGRTVADTYESSGDVSRIGDEMAAAVLRFRSADVTHVVESGPTLFFFMQAAEAQSYRPRYVVYSAHAPGQFLQTSAPKAQLAGALGVGLSPTLDVDNARDPGDVSSAETRCRQVMQKTGQDTSSRETFGIMVRACDGFNFVVAAITSGELSPAGLKLGAGAMGLMPPAGTFRISFPGGRSDGATVVRDLGYRGDCSCFVYLSRTNHEF